MTGRRTDGEVERALTEWGRSVRETAELRSQHVRIDRTRLLQAVLRPYRQWTWALRWAVGLAAVWSVGAGLYFYVLRDRELRGWPTARGEWRMVQSVEAPGSDGPVDPELPAQVHALLMALRQPGRTSCPDRADGLDFRSEAERVRRLYQTWALTVPRWDDPYGGVLRRLAVTVEPCLSPEQARTLQAWSQDVSAYLYLTRPMGKW